MKGYIVKDGGEVIHGYLRRVVVEWGEGQTEVLTGSVDLLVGTRYGSPERSTVQELAYLPPKAPLNGSTIEISFDGGGTYEFVEIWGKDDINASLRS